MPVRRTDDHDHSQLPDLKVADTVLDCDPDHVMLSRHPSGTLGQYGVSAGVITVVEGVDSAPLIAAAYDTEKDAYSSDLRRRHRSDELVHTERGVSYASQSDLRKHPQTLAEPAGYRTAERIALSAIRHPTRRARQGGRVRWNRYIEVRSWHDRGSAARFERSAGGSVAAG